MSSGDTTQIGAWRPEMLCDDRRLRRAPASAQELCAEPRRAGHDGSEPCRTLVEVIDLKARARLEMLEVAICQSQASLMRTMNLLERRLDERFAHRCLKLEEKVGDFEETSSRLESRADAFEKSVTQQIEEVYEQFEYSDEENHDVSSEEPPSDEWCKLLADLRGVQYRTNILEQHLGTLDRSFE